jgi:hypothetical protein
MALCFRLEGDFLLSRLLPAKKLVVKGLNSYSSYIIAYSFKLALFTAKKCP